MVATKKITVADMLAIEPRIKAIIGRVRNEESWDFAYSKAKALAYRLVGWGAENEAIKSEAAYNTFISYICDRLDAIYP